MTKLVTIVKDKKQIKELINYSDAFIIGIKDLSVNMPCYFEIEELKEINEYLKENNKELFVSLNKNFHTIELDKLKEVLFLIENLDVKGILYYDVCLVNLKQELNLKTDLVWNQEHSTTNYATANFWYEHGVKYMNVSHEITLKEIEEINENTEIELMVNILGYIPMFTSERKLISNYKEKFNLNPNTNKYYLHKENNIYNLVEDKNVTTMYSSGILNAYNEYLILKDKINYFILNSFEIDNDIFKEIIKGIKEENITEESIDKLLLNTTKSFLHTETIYRVKEYGKNK